MFLCSDNDNVALGFADPGTLEANPGWPLRNLLALVARAQPDRLRRNSKVVHHSVLSILSISYFILYIYIL